MKGISETMQARPAQHARNSHVGRVGGVRTASGGAGTAGACVPRPVGRGLGPDAPLSGRADGSPLLGAQRPLCGGPNVFLSIRGQLGGEGQGEEGQVSRCRFPTSQL